jgi:amino acid adenylation domain-containing protein
VTAAELLTRLRSLDVRIWSDKGQLQCNGPKEALTAELRAALTERKAEILELLNQANNVTLRRQPPLRPMSRDGEVPLSFAQQRLWFMDQLEPGSALYNVPKAFRVCGALHAQSLEQSLNEVVRRHDVLRTTFQVTDGRPVQNISTRIIVSLHLTDLTDRPESGRNAEALRLINEEACRPFDLARGPLLRACLVRLAAEDHILLVTLHHIVSDGWSMGILYRELSALYNAFLQGRPSPLEELPLQYVDFARWQREWLQGEVLQSQVAYWKERLANIPSLQLLTDRQRPAVQSYRGAWKSIVLNDRLCQALDVFSQGERASLFMTLLAAFNVLLCRYSGQDDIVIGTPIAGRNRSEVEDLIGFFVNALVLRTDLAGDPTFRELLGRVRDGALDAYAHQDLPFEKLVEEVAPERNPGHAPLTQVMFAYQNFPDSPIEMSGCSVQPLDIDTGIAKFDLTLQVSKKSYGMRCVLAYGTDLFDSETIARMLGHFRTLLEAIVTDPNRRISELPILDEAERHRILVEWNDTKREYPHDKFIHELFEEQAQRTPDAVAAVFEGQQLTYQELNTRANQLAHYLKRQGVGSEVLVGICVERSLEIIVGLLGILKAGGAYVPLDPSYPKERLAFILKDTGAKVLLTQQKLAPELPEHTARVICLETARKMIERESELNLNRESVTDQLAYVIYTSGSTGQPKGVAIAHKSTSTLLYWARELLTPEDIGGVLASTSICFDLSVFEIFVPLSWGGKVILLENALQISTLPEADQVTLLNTVPSAMAELLKLGSVPPSVRKVFLAGELLTTALVQRIYQGPSILNVVDLYGPSEDTTYSTFAVRSSGGRATIGRPIAETQIYLLDKYLNPVPPRAPGELYISGQGLARGYLKRPALTAEKFIPNPFSAEPGARLYKTGDLARYQYDGNIEFLGRIDHQVKIRGFRIELGEIETVLEEHALVGEAVVEARGDAGVDRRLVAYVVSRGPVQVVDLRNFLKAKLPDHMVPSVFVLVESLPRTPSGKVDRQALPAPDQDRPDLKNVFVAPSTPTEELIARTWADILKVERVGIHDNFFELGGHSLLATQVVSRLRATFRVNLPLRSLFECPTVADLSERIETLVWALKEPNRGSDSEEREEMKL